jgi:Kdo2-lipid IVA lauroyltransferase/acyltransferase
MFFYFLYKTGQILVKILSLKNAYRLAKRVALLRYYFSTGDKKLITENLKAVLEAKGQYLSKKQIEELAKESYINFGKFLVEFFKFSKIDEEFIKKKVRIEGDLNLLRRLLDRGKGVVTVSAHLGNWEIGAAVLRALSYPVNAITLPHTSIIVSNFFNGIRKSLSIGVIPTGIAVRRCFKLLKNNEMVSFLGDVDFSGSGVKTKFMGRDAVIPKGPAVISLKTQAPIFLVFLIREKDNNFRLIIEEPIFPSDYQNNPQSVKTLTKEYTDKIEKQIKEHPTQWLMFHKVWN